ncbi:hypothetical protein FBU31_006725 [Coemansia sp. 'formosensis']|nr:hypothetical protein FBU31_006725 [Coemansia sp. 'formosensis']
MHNSSAISAGLHLLPYILPISIFPTILGFVIAKTGCYCELLQAGRSITTIGTGLYVLLDDSISMGKSIDLTLISGAGMGLPLQPMQQNYTCQAYAPVPTVHISTRLSSAPAPCCLSSARP